MSNHLASLQNTLASTHIPPWLPHELPMLYGVAIAFFLVVALWAWTRPQSRDRGQHVRGNRLVAFGFVGLRRRLARDPHRLRIGGVALPRALESLHLLITGATGAGKSQTIHGTLATLRARGDTAIITDIGGEALRGFGQAGDMLLNPLDARSVSWSPFAELDSPSDADRLAKSMIPDQVGIRGNGVRSCILPTYLVCSSTKQLGRFPIRSKVTQWQ